MRTSYKKNRPFDFKLIDLVEPNPVLYQRHTGLSNYETMKAKNLIWDKIAEIMGRNVEFCLMRWNNLRYQYQKEVRRSERLCPKLGIIRGSTWPYLERLRFLADLQPRLTRKSPNKQITPTQEPLAPTETSTAAEQEIWQAYNDCMVLHVCENEETTYIDDEQRYIIEEIIEEPNQPIIQEEIIYEDEQDEQDSTVAQDSSEKPCTYENSLASETSSSNFLKMDSILSQLKGIQQERAERRIMAFVLKCQLRSLLNQPIDDLVI